MFALLARKASSPSRRLPFCPLPVKFLYQEAARAMIVHADDPQHQSPQKSKVGKTTHDFTHISVFSGGNFRRQDIEETRMNID
jgi:hypothetical protein